MQSCALVSESRGAPKSSKIIKIKFSPYLKRTYTIRYNQCSQTLDSENRMLLLKPNNLTFFVDDITSPKGRVVLGNFNFK